MGLVELFCGIGGVAEAARQLNYKSQFGDLQTRIAVDIDRDCGEVYRQNFGMGVLCKTIESLDWSELAGPVGQSELWWLSPPCQPYCRRGQGQCDTDDRCQALLSMISWLETRPAHLPSSIVFENVPEFSASSHAVRLKDALSANGFSIHDLQLCPTQFGIPNRRRRFYLIASQEGQVRPLPIAEATVEVPLADYLEPEPPSDSELWLRQPVAAKYAGAMDIVDIDKTDAITACFAGGYGKSIIRSGSYLKQSGRLRRFSPREVARLLGFSDDFAFPEQFSMRKQWKMLGNGLSIPVVRSLLSGL